MDEHLFIRFCWLVGFLLREKVLSDTLALFVYPNNPDAILLMVISGFIMR